MKLKDLKTELKKLKSLNSIAENQKFLQRLKEEQDLSRIRNDELRNSK